MKAKFKIDLTPSQQEAYDLICNEKQYKYYSLAWSRQSGKSTLMKVLCCKWLLEYQSSVGYVCKNFILAKKLYKDLVNLLPKQLVKNANGTDLIIEGVFGSTVQFFSAESGSSLRGFTFRYLICDEFAFFKDQLPDGTSLWFDVLFPTIKARGKKVIFVSTPLGKNNLFYQMYMKPFQYDEKFNQIMNINHKYCSITKTIYDDGLVSEEDIEEIKNSIPNLTWKQEFLCEFLDSANTFFGGFEDCFNETSKRYKKTWIGIDLSGNGSDETILTKVNENNECESIRIDGSLDVKYAKIATIINESVNLQAVYVENNGLGAPMLNEIKKLVKNRSILHEWTTTNTTKEDIISRLAVDIAKKEVVFDVADKALFAQFGTFVCKTSKTGKLLFEASAGNHDDKIMSLAIALQAKRDFKFDSQYYFNPRVQNKRFI